ncbi:MAG: calcium-translocating P-type ATPase, PMCA-type [Christensenellaceae bacterium]|nr:calcium-translocating P-type ATPase, PMCA-type [Christensenellaceae bacterium]
MLEESPFCIKPERVFEALGTRQEGLSREEAARRMEAYGPNTLREGRKKTLLGIIISQFKNLMILVLLAAAVLSLIIGHDMADAIIIFAVIILNAAMGTIQEAKAEAALEALKKLSAPTARVIRGGQVATVPASELVVGDVVLLEAGDYVPADIRLTETASLRIDEAMLTGESVPVEKDAAAVLPEQTPLAERVNMAYAGTSVTYGRGTGVVAGTGMQTEIGRIAGALDAAKESQTPLQRRMDALSRVLSIAVLAVAAVIFAVGLVTGRDILDMFMVAISLAVAAIPEGLATVVTLQLTMGVQKMSKNGAIVRRLPAVETLGSTSVICSDKTGTLTQNRMTVKRAYYNFKAYEADAVPPCPERELLDRVFALCNDTKVADGSGEEKLVGDPTETGLYAFSAPRVDMAAWPRVYEIPFDSERKLMSTVNGRETLELLVKGAPDELIARCSRVMAGGEIRPLSDEYKRRLLDANEDFARQALRVLGAAFKPLQSVPLSDEGLEEGLIFVGLAGMMDPPRPEAAEAVALCRQAGIRAVMITGDHKATAVAIARELGILEQGSRAITGAELAGMSDEELAENIDDIRGYARVAPEHKVRIVQAFQDRGCVVAMTGDGVNDAPALKNADIGVGMGITGTEVSKNASDMVLTDDNFATIVRAVQEGRRIYRNIRKAVQFLLSANLAEVVTLFVGTMAGLVVLTPVQILWVNLVTDTLPALALGMEPAPDDIMRRKPRDPKQSFFAEGMAANLIVFGVIMSALTLGAYFLGLSRYHDSAVANTMAFMVLGLVQLFHVFNIRSTLRSVIKGFWHNKWMHISFIVSALLQTVVVWYAPLAAFFGVTALTGTQWLYTVALGISVVPISEFVKWIKRQINRGVK